MIMFKQKFVVIALVLQFITNVSNVDITYSRSVNITTLQRPDKLSFSRQPYNILRSMSDDINSNFTALNITLDASVNSYVIKGLTPNTSYTARMYSWITDIDGNIEISTSTPTTYKTLPVVCPTSIVIYPVSGVNENATFLETLTGYSKTSLETCPESSSNTGIPLGTRACSLNGEWQPPTFLTTCERDIQDLATENITTEEQRVNVTSELIVLTSNPEMLKPTGIPLGTRACSLNGEWQPPTFLTTCERDIQDLATENITTEEQRVNVTSELIVLTSNPEMLKPSDIQDATDVLEVVVETDSLEPNTSALVVETVGNLLAAPQDELAASGTSKRLLSTLDDVALKVNLSEGEQFQSITSTLAMSVLSLPKNESVDGVGFTVDDNPLVNELGFNSDQFNVVYVKSDIIAPSSIYISGEVISKTTDGKISFYSFVNDNAFSATSPLHVSSDAEVTTASKSVVNSQIVLAATVVNSTTLINNISNAIEIRFELNQNVAPFVNESSASTLCAFWEEVDAYWSTRGCVTIVSNTSVQCQCDHLTNFASLFAYGELIEEDILDILTYIGSSISIIAIVCTILSLLCVWNSYTLSMQKATKVVMLNLSLALLFLNVFLLVSELYVVTSNDTSCLAVAIIIHFSLFSSLAWMMVEAIYLFIAITKPIYFRTKLPEKRFFVITSLWGWGFPTLFITLVAAIKSEWYKRNDDKCWIDSDMIVYLVIIPAALIIFCNLTCYIVVLVTFLKHKKPGSKSAENRKKRNILFSFTLFITFGLTWIFGFLLFSSSLINIIFAYIFTILNALQGVFVFILFIYRNKTLRETVSQQMVSLVSFSNLVGVGNTQDKTSARESKMNVSTSGEVSNSATATS